jgi:GT2 family glycosyltransferase
MEQKTTIIIVTFNAYNYVKKCLESVLKHTNSIHDVIIIDNKSDAKTREYVKSYSSVDRVKIILNEKNVLWCPACNQGFKQASNDTKFVVLLNSDVEIHKNDWIFKLQKPMLNNEVIGQTGTKYNFQPIKPTYGALDGCCLMIKKSLLDDIGYFDEDYPWNGAPYIFTQKAWKKGIKYFHIIDKQLITHFGRKSRLDKNIQLKNNYIDKKAIISNEGLVPVYDIYSWLLNKISIFDINKKLYSKSISE